MFRLCKTTIMRLLIPGIHKFRSVRPILILSLPYQYRRAYFACFVLLAIIVITFAEVLVAYYESPYVQLSPSLFYF
jgi:hypothetical protein